MDGDAAISVVIVSYNTAELLLRCLESLQKQQALVREIIVVDNNSQDNSAAEVRRYFPSVQLLALPENIGFGRANNRALANCTGELLFLLNPDTMLLPGCLAAIQTYMAEHPEIGMAGAAVYDGDEALQTTVFDGYPGSHYAGATFAGLPGNITWILGASLVVRRQVMGQVGGFDPGYFLYGEDIDLGLRIRKAGWALGYIPEARLIHLEGQSERSTPHAALFEKKLRAELLFYRKHYPPEIIRRIKRVRWIQAQWRLFSLRLSGLFMRESERSRKNRIKYTVAARLYR